MLLEDCSFMNMDGGGVCVEDDAKVKMRDVTLCLYL